MVQSDNPVGNGTAYGTVDNPVVRDGLAVCAIATTVPWNLGVDAMVISVGEVLGGLGEAVSQQMPELPWHSTTYSKIDPSSPLGLETKRRPPEPQLLILASAHPPRARTATVESIGLATANALRFAAGYGVSTVGVPLLGTGRLGMTVAEIAGLIVPMVLDDAEQLVEMGLQEVVFFDRSEQTAEQLRALLRLLESAVSSEIPFVAPVVPQELDPDGGEQPSAETADPREDVGGPIELAAGHSVDLVDPTQSISLDKDCLGMRPYVSMLATLIASCETEEPLSVGVFGDWGSGKSYFMAMLRGEIDRLSTLDDDRYYHRIRPIAFNAWTYADSNLWASLGDEVFRQLLGAPMDVAADDQSRLQDELTASLEQRKLLEAAQARAKDEAAELQLEVGKAAADRNIRMSDVAKAVLRSPTVRAQAKTAWLAGLDKDAVISEVVLAQEASGAATEARAFLRTTLTSNRAWAVGLAAILAVLVTVATAILAPHLRATSYGLSVVFATIATGAAAVAARTHNILKFVRVVTEELSSGIQDARQSRVKPALEELHKAQARHQLAQAQLQEVVARVGELRGQLVELTPGARLYSLIADRVAGDTYGKNLGLISMVRRDFGELVRLLKEQRRAPGADEEGEHSSIDRIVLYIDDLDRCTPRRVVEVLEAVHLLLAIPLFVVVIGVDPRWLLRALSTEYRDILGNGSDMAAVAPEDYLEKIINVPVILPAMAESSMGALVRGLLAEQTTRQRGNPIAAQYGRGLASIMLDEVDSPLNKREFSVIEPSSEVAAQQLRRSLPPPRLLTEPEAALLGSLDGLIDTPRDAKRLVNIYRMIRSTRDLSDAADFLGTSERPGEYQAVTLLLGLTTFHARLAEQVFDAPAVPDHDLVGGIRARSARDPWSGLVADLKPDLQDSGWSNRIVGALSPEEATPWLRAYRGLAGASAKVTIIDLSVFQSWIPKIRRFSFIMAGRR